jgi:Ca-activated chloride channel family protein
VNELPKIYEQISQELSTLYSLAYTSKNPLRNGAWRRIVVRIARPGHIARTRQGYYGPSAP